MANPLFVVYLLVAGHYRKCVSSGMQATTAHRMPNGTVRLGRTFTSGVVLVGAQMDRIGKMKASGFASGNNATMACGNCAMTGTHVKGFTRQLGYDEPVVATLGKCTGVSLLLGRDDERRLLSHKEQTERAVYTEQQLAL